MECKNVIVIEESDEEVDDLKPIVIEDSEEEEFQTKPSYSNSPGPSKKPVYNVFTFNRFETLPVDVDDAVDSKTHRKRKSSSVAGPSKKSRVSKYVWSDTATALLIKCCKEQRISQLANPKILEHPTNFDLNALVASFNAEATDSAAKDQLVQKIKLSKIFRNWEYEDWKFEILAEIESRKKRNEQIDVPRDDDKYKWDELTTNLLRKHIKEQRIQELADTTIFIHPTSINQDALVASFNAEATNPATKDQLKRKMVKSKMFRSSEYAMWKNENQEEIERRKKENVQIEAFQKAKIINITNVGKWSAEEEAVGYKIMKNCEGDSQDGIAAKIFEALQGRRSESGIKQHFFYRKENTKSSHSLWTSSEDTIIQSKLMPLIEKKEKVSWNVIFEDIKSELPGRNLNSVKSRFENYLNPAWDNGAVDINEKEDIIRNFEEFGFTFSQYNSRKRSVQFLRRFITKYIDEIHRSTTSNSICSLFYEKLAESLKSDDGSISVDDWMDKCAMGNRQLKTAYKFIIAENKQNLANTYGIVIANDHVSLDNTRVYTLMYRRKLFPMTKEDIIYVDNLISKYRKIDKQTLPIVHTKKILKLIDGRLVICTSQYKAPKDNDDWRQFSGDIDRDIEIFLNDIDEELPIEENRGSYNRGGSRKCFDPGGPHYLKLIKMYKNYVRD